MARDKGRGRPGDTDDPRPQGDSGAGTANDRGPGTTVPGGSGGGGGGGSSIPGDSKEAMRARRQAAAARWAEVESALASSGAPMEEILAGLGIYDEKHKGRALYQQVMNLIPSYGMGVNMGDTYDWNSGQKWDPNYGTDGRTDPRQVQNPNGDSYHRGGWVPITADEYASRKEADARRAQYGDSYNPWRLDRLEYDKRAGHVTRDAASGMYYNDPGNDVNQRQWFDEGYRNTSAPSGWSPTVATPGVTQPAPRPTGTSTNDALTNSLASNGAGRPSTPARGSGRHTSAGGWTTAGTAPPVGTSSSAPGPSVNPNPAPAASSPSVLQSNAASTQVNPMGTPEVKKKRTAGWTI